MSEKLLDKKVKMMITTRNQMINRDDGKYAVTEAEMTIRNAIKAGYLSDNEVALQIFEQIEAQ